MPNYQWLTEAYVLTQAIKSKYKNYSLQLIKQELTATPIEDQQALNISEQSFVRRVLQSGDNIPLCYARTTIPLITFEKYRAEFENLGEQPIGETLLYNNPAVTRSEFEVCCITSANPLLQEAINAANQTFAELWARRSVFWLEKHPLLITEIILT